MKEERERVREREEERKKERESGRGRVRERERERERKSERERKRERERESNRVLTWSLQPCSNIEVSHITRSSYCYEPIQTNILLQYKYLSLPAINLNALKSYGNESCEAVMIINV